jgi:hypothetical protein
VAVSVSRGSLSRHRTHQAFFILVLVVVVGKQAGKQAFVWWCGGDVETEIGSLPPSEQASNAGAESTADGLLGRGSSK